ncbi:MAG: PD-(D/E)XK nuclease family protein, partial [Thermoanaerobaculia bacterium]
GELTRLQIPFFRPVGTTLAQRPIGRAALLAVELCARDFRRETLLEFFDLLDSLGVLSALGGSSSASLVRTIETLGFGEGRARWPAMVARAERALRSGAHAEDDSDNDAFASARRERHLARLGRLRQAIEFLSITIPEDRPASWHSWGSRLGKMFEALLGRHEDHPLLIDALAEISALEVVEPGAAITGAEILTALQEVLSTSPTSAGRFERDGVTLLSAIAARGLRFDTVIIPGLVEKSFPASARPDPLLSDGERQALAQQAHVRLPARTGARHAGEERFLFTLATQTAERRLVLTAARRDATRDKSRILSPFLLEAMEKLKPIIENEDLTPSEGARSEGISSEGIRSEETPSEGNLSAAVRRTVLGRMPHDGPPLDEEELLRRVLDREPARRAFIEASAKPLGRAFRRGRARAMPAFTEYEGLIGRPVPFLTDEHPVSATRLERLAGCAYRAFLGDVLHLNARDASEAPLYPDNLNLGILVHAALTEAARLLILRGTSFAELPAGEADLLAARLAARHLDDWAAAGGIETYPVFMELSRAEFTAILQALFAHARTHAAGALPLAGAEVRFGPRRSGSNVDDEDPELSFDESPSRRVGERSVSFAGMIDRVDRAPGRVHVIDYKIGKPLPYRIKNTRNYLIAGGERSQLAIYALAAERLGDEHGGDVSSEFLFVERTKPGVAPRVVAHTFDAGRTSQAVKNLDQLLAGMLDVAAFGTFFPTTSSLRVEDSPCGTCDFNPVCGAGHMRVLERKWSGDHAANGPGETIREMRRIP